MASLGAKIGGPPGAGPGFGMMGIPRPQPKKAENDEEKDKP